MIASTFSNPHGPTESRIALHARYEAGIILFCARAGLAGFGRSTRTAAQRAAFREKQQSSVAARPTTAFKLSSRGREFQDVLLFPLKQLPQLLRHIRGFFSAAVLAQSQDKLLGGELAARRALRRGVPARLTGTPKYNIHANDIDFQIEADFIDLMAPGLPQASNDIALRAGRVMNYGDGIYGGMFVSCMYAAAFF